MLIHPPMDLRKQLGKFRKVSIATPPLGLAYIASFLEEKGYDVFIFDAFVLNAGMDEIMEFVKKRYPNLVGISCLTPTAPTAHQIANNVKKWNEECIVVMGGVHPTLMPSETLQNRNVDVVVRGEGELTMFELVECIKEGRPLKNIKGISYRRENAEIIHTINRPFIEKLDKLPFPAWHLLPLKKYTPPPHWIIELPSLPLLSSRGCPYRCKFCSLSTQGKQNRARSPENVVDEVEYVASEYGVKEIMFWDANFPFDKKRAMKICEEIIKRGLHKEIVWLSETRPNLVDKEILTLMKKSGCRRVAYGIESGVQHILNDIRKGFTIEQVKKAVKLTREVGLEIIGYFMLGLPGETEETAKETIEFAKRIDPDYAKFNLTVPYPGTQLFDEAVKEGTLKSKDWDKYSSLSGYSNYEPVYVPRDMTAQQLKRLQKEAMRSFYLRPNKIISYMRKIRTLHDIRTYFSIAKSIITE